MYQNLSYYSSLFLKKCVVQSNMQLTDFCTSRWAAVPMILKNLHEKRINMLEAAVLDDCIKDIQYDFLDVVKSHVEHYIPSKVVAI
jgi:hypothetical protein